MLMLRAREGWGNEFINYVELDYFQKVSKKYSIDVIEIGSEAEWQAFMQSNQKKYDRIDIVSHGNQEEIELSSEIDLSADSKVTLQWLSDRIKEGGIMALNCCNSAEGEENIARTISRACPHALVRGSPEKIDSVHGIHYNQDGIPSYTNGVLCKAKNITRIYRNGVLLRHRRRHIN